MRVGASIVLWAVVERVIHVSGDATDRADAHAARARPRSRPGRERWLELRLAGRPARIAGWAWPALSVLIGAILLSYREA